ncbi:MAG TPA: hypothetical protein VGI16_12485, partial [Candidatus Acidoferrum sp.]
KLFYWVMFWATLVLLLSGVGLWFVESIPWSLRWLRYAAVLLHVSAALVTIGAMIIHVYMGTALVRGSFDGMVRGVVPPAWARTHHRLWYDAVTGQPRDERSGVLRDRIENDRIDALRRRPDDPLPPAR